MAAGAADVGVDAAEVVAAVIGTRADATLRAPASGSIAKRNLTY